MRDVIIFGAGKRGYALAKRIGGNRVRCFCDNSSERVGNTPGGGYTVISFEKMKELCNEYDVILSTDSEEMRRQLLNSGIKFWESEGFSNNYFLQEDVKIDLDKQLMERFIYDKELMSFAFARTAGAEFRLQFYDEENKKLVGLMRAERERDVLNLLNSIYANYQEIQVDDRYDMRPGLKLITNIIESKRDKDKSVRICDLACGHGGLLTYLKKKGCCVFGVEADESRRQFCEKQGIDCSLGSAERTNYPDCSFDFVTCTEYMEHAMNPLNAVKEINRILTNGGLVFVTVPYGRACDCKTHVRHFDISDMYSLFSRECFEIVNIIRMPYLYMDIKEDNIFLCAMKKMDE